MNIAVLGTGLLGSGFTRALRRRGETVQVWNRTRARADLLAAAGALIAATPADAVRGAARVHLTLADDAAVDAVLDAARPGFAPGALVIDHSTTSLAGICERTRRWRSAGVTYQHAPVFMGPKHAEESTGLMMISGDREIVERVKPLLAPMTGKLVDFGDRVDAAGAFKLLGNSFLMAFTVGCADMFALAKAVGVAPAEAAAFFEHFNPGLTLGARLKRMTDGNYDKPSWELAMARKDARLVQDEVDHAGIALALLPAIVARMDTVLAEGHAHSDWTVLAKDFV